MTQNQQVTIHHDDCLTALRAMPDASVSAIVTDPPYGLSNTDPSSVAGTITKWATGDREHVPTGRGFMGKAWDAFVPPPAVWDECLRVLKPGGHMVVFAGSRTQDLMGLSIRLAGFDIRDSVAWLYGSGFPKSLDVSKAIDSTGGVSAEGQARVLRDARERAGLSREAVAEAVGCTPSSIRDWEEGRSRAKGKATEFITPSPAYRAKLADLLGYTEDERVVVGVGGGSRGLYETGHRGIEYGGPQTDAAREWEGWGTALKPAHEPVIVARKPLEGTVAGNVLEHGTGALNVDASRIGGPSGRWPANVVLDESQAAALDRQSGRLKSGSWDGRRTSNKMGDSGIYGNAGAHPEAPRSGDEGGASRFFYTAKASKAERPVVDGTAHPTVKPLAIMRWLIRLTTPPGGMVLDPFAGSGTTIEAAILEGFPVTGIEREADYLPLIQARIDRATAPAPKPEPSLFGDLTV